MSQVEEALLAHAERASQETEHALLLAALGADLVVGVVPRLTRRDETTGADKESEMELLVLERGGESAVPAFSSWDRLQGWLPEARPVTVPGRDLLAQAARDGRSAVVLDLGSHVEHAIDRDVLDAVARGYLPLAGAPGVWRQSPA